MSYTNVSVNISENQQQKLKHAIDTKIPASISLDYADLCGSDVLALTNSQVKRMTKAYLDGKAITIKMSKRQVVNNMKINGGFLGFLAGLAAKALPFLAKTVLPTLATGALSGVGSALAQKATKNYGEWVVFEKRFKHRKGRNGRSRAVFETVQRFGTWHGWRWFVFETGGQVLTAMAFFLVRTVL